MQLELNDNVSAIATLLGDGVSDHIFFTLTPVEYVTLTGMIFVPLVNPGMAPFHSAFPVIPTMIAEPIQLYKHHVQFRYSKVKLGLDKTQRLV